MKPAHTLFFLRRCSNLDWHGAVLALGGALALQLACSAGDDPASERQTIWGADPCLETTTHPDYPQDVYYQRKLWASAARILTVEGSPSPAFTKVDTLKTRYADAGRVIAYIGVEQPFQHDYIYDEHDNVSEFRLSYPDRPDVLTTSTASTWIGYRNQNEYNPAGRLTASNVSSYGDSAPSPPYRLSFGEDDAGRCQRIEQTGSSGVSTVETRSYDDAGRLKHTETTMDGALYSHADLTYDEQGRLHTRSYTVDMSQGFGVGGGTGTATTTYDYASDGSQTITYFDPLTDISNDEHVVVTRTGACQAIDDAIGAPADLRCRLRSDNK